MAVALGGAVEGVEDANGVPGGEDELLHPTSTMSNVNVAIHAMYRVRWVATAARGKVSNIFSLSFF